MQNTRILVIGSTGKTGRRVARRLEERGHAVREGSRRADPPFDWEEPATWPAALRGVRAAYVTFFPDLAVSGAPAAIEELVRQAREAGVEKLVLLSGRGEPNAQRCEDIVRESGLGFTLIRASWFAQNFDEGQLLGPVLEGRVALPVGEVGEPFVDADDIADVAVAALTEDGHDGRLYEVTGPRLLTFAQAVEEISRAAGRQVQFVSVSPDQFRSALTEQAGPEVAGLLSDLFGEVLDGRNAWVADGVETALGREPRDFADFCRAAAASGAWDRPTRERRTA